MKMVAHAHPAAFDPLAVQAVEALRVSRTDREQPAPHQSENHARQALHFEILPS